MGKIIYCDFQREQREKERTEITHSLLKRIADWEHYDVEAANIEKKRLQELVSEDLYYQKLRESGENVFDRFD